MEKETPLVSIIMPAYNVEEYISETITSVINQTYTNWELIIVNDGSTDTTEKIITNYCNTDFRIKLINQGNQKQGIARNNGYKQAKGDYVYFSDSDDILHPQLIETCVTYISKDTDIIKFDWELFYDSIPNIQLINKFDANAVEKITTNLALYTFPPTPFSYFFNKKFLEKSEVDFPNYFHEDEAEIYRIISFATEIIEIPNILYFYRKRQNSTTGLSINKNSVDLLKAANRYIDLSKKDMINSYFFVFKAYKLIYNIIDNWKSRNEDWAIQAANEGEIFLNNIIPSIENNPFFIVEQQICKQYENSMSWKITKPLRVLKKIIKRK